MQMSASPFADVPLAPPDPILGLTAAFLADTNPDKVNLGVGVYQDSTGRVPTLQCVRTAESRWLHEEPTKSYLPIDGVPAYNAAIQDLLFGSDSAVVSDGRAVTVQALGGTGALRVGAELLRRTLADARVHISQPSWENHRALFEATGFDVSTYPYYRPETHDLDFESMLSAINNFGTSDIVVLHACCHNPSGVDLSDDQWPAVVASAQRNGWVPFLDFAYQGFGEGLQQDAVAVRAFADAGVPCVIANSFSKSFSLYRERVGGLTVLTSDRDESARVLSQLKRIIRTLYSNPASHGAQVVAMILNDPALRTQWEQELEEMRQRIGAMRAAFVEGLVAEGITRDFSFIKRQRGMFSFSGLSVEQVHRLRSEFGLYIVDSGRICVAAMNDRNLKPICSAIAKVLQPVCVS
jgi:aromatic-amino-acid transaminase